MISRHRKELSAWYHMILPSEEVVDLMLSKDKFYAYAEARGLPIPRTVIVSKQPTWSER
jgi:predicted ATP-grasp superfamily ATP-dependent carboligase